MANEHLHHLNQDLLMEILSRADGATLAAVDSTCSNLHVVAKEESLWKDLCHNTWPSTQGKEAHDLISSLGGFKKFYADSYPLVVHRKESKVQRITHKVSPRMESQAQRSTHEVFPIRESQVQPSIHRVSSSDFVSLVDVYYEERCIFSKVLHDIPGKSHGYDDNWFLDCPFRFTVLDYQNEGTRLDDDGYEEIQDNHTMDTIPSVPIVEKKDEANGNLCWKLIEKVRLSWIVINTKSWKAVNLSSWKPISAQRHWPSESDFLLCFGCVVPVEEQLLPSKLAECVISVRCELKKKEECLIWTELNMQIEDLEGVHVNGRKSMIVLQRAFEGERSRHLWEVKRGYEEYKNMKREVLQKKLKNDRFADYTCLICGIAILGYLCLYFFS